MASPSLHEDFDRKSGETQSSERGFGQVFAAVCGLIGVAKLYHGAPYVAWLVACGVFLVLAYFWTAPLKPLNLIWHKFGLLLFKITNPLIMAIIYFGSVVPTGMILRLMKDILRKWDASAVYWLLRTLLRQGRI